MKAFLAKELYDGELYRKDVFVVVNDEGMLDYVGHERPEGLEIDEVPVMTPGFIDVHSHIGLSRWGAPSNDSDVNDYIEFTNPSVEAFDAFDHEDPSLKEAVEFGVLVSCILPGSGNLLGGGGAVVYNHGTLKDDRYIKSGGLKAALGENPKFAGQNKSNRPTTRLGVFGVLRQRLEEAVGLQKLIEKGKKEWEEVDVKKRRWIKLIRGEEVLRVHVHAESDLLSLFRIADQYGFKFTVEHGGNLHNEAVFEELLKRGVPFNYGPIDAFAYKHELRFDTWRNLEKMRKVGLKFALMTDHPVVLSRNLFMQLRYFLLVGYSKSEAIATITKNAAENLGIADRMGTISKGKEANLLFWDGDPFELPSKPSKVMLKGRLIGGQSTT